MLRRLFVGLMLGLLIGSLLGAALVLGLKVLTFDGAGGLAIAYLAAAVAGVLTGLVAGKPIWAVDARIEAGLKAFFGALLGAGAMFAIRQWGGGWVIDLSAFHAGGPAAIGALPAASLPILAAALGALFELDNAGGPPEPKSVERRRVAVPREKSNNAVSRVEAGDDVSVEAADGSGSKRAKR